MTSDNPIAVIELGNISLKCIIFKINKNNLIEILSSATINSRGIHNGIIVNIAEASNVIRSCISDAEKKADVTLKKINVIIEQPDFLCTTLSKNKKIGGSKIFKDDIDFLLKEGKKQITHNDNRQTIIHIFNHNYIVDGKSFIKEPIDIYADHLSHEMTFISTPKNNIKNIVQTFINCDIEVERFISSIFSLAVQLLDNEELNSGSIIVDIGYEKISLGIFKNLAIIHSMTLPIGVNHIKKDISKVCSLNLNEAKKIRNEIDYSLENNNHIFDENNNLLENYLKNGSTRKISKSLILNIIQSRLDEILEILKKQILFAGFNPNHTSNIYIVGGGSKLPNIENYFSNFFHSKVSKLSNNINKNFKNELGENFDTCLGALKIIKDGWETEAIPEKVNKYAEKKGFFAKIFGKAQ